MKNKFIYFAVLAALGFASCEPEFENEVNANYTAGEADFTTYVAIGNSLTAGYMDNTVSRVGQTYSYPNLLAQQFALVGGGEFSQPSFADDVNNLGGLSLGGIQLAGTRLIIDASESRPENIAGTSTIEISAQQATAYNNMGVPGAKSFHLLAPGYGNLAGLMTGQANPYFVRHATSANATVLGDAMTKNPTFFTNWIGSNDVLAFATSGGTGVDHNDTGNTDPATYGGNDITNTNVFANVYTTIVNTLTANGAKGVVATIPSVTSIPYFTTVPYNALPAEATSSNATVLGLYQFLAAATNGRIDALSTTAGTKNPVLIQDEALADLSAQITLYANNSGNPLLVANANALGQVYGKARQATASDLLVLTSRAVIGQINNNATAPFNVEGVTLPLADKWALVPSEIAAIASATTSFNNIIKTIAASKNLAVADMNKVMDKLIGGLRIETGQTYTADYFSGSSTEGSVLFSLDGVHPNARGYAVIANEIIKVINTHYKANIPLHHPSYFPGISILPTN